MHVVVLGSWMKVLVLGDLNCLGVGSRESDSTEIPACLVFSGCTQGSASFLCLE